MTKSLTIDFLHRYEWRSKDNKFSPRPYASIGLVGKTGAVYPIWSLVDTGADSVQLDIRLGVWAGYDPRSAPQHKAKLANGSYATFYRVPNVDIEVEGAAIRQTVLFADNAPNILGRQAIIEAIELGLDVDGWLFKYK